MFPHLYSSESRFESEFTRRKFVNSSSVEITINAYPLPSVPASLLVNVVARVHASLDGRVSDRLCRIIRGGCVCHEVGRGRGGV